MRELPDDWLSRLSVGSLKFELVRPTHAAFIYSLRVDPELNAHLSPPPVSVHAQEDWIKSYVEREKLQEEFYFVIVRSDGQACGTVRLYDFCETSFCWGSWILNRDKTRYAAIETAVLVYRLGFDLLKFPKSQFDVRRSNARVIDFHLRLGAQKTSEDVGNLYFEMSKDAYRERLPGLMAIVNGYCSPE